VYRRQKISGRRGERGVVILLVAIVLLFVVGAMAVLAIDLVTFYTARSEAQLAADGAALAGARMLANSGMTSNPADANLTLDATNNVANAVATQVAMSNKVAGRNLTAGEIVVTFPNQLSPEFGSNPQIRVQVSRNDVPTFFARIWGSTQVTVKATATAEAYNPSGLNTSSGAAPPVAQSCVKPWVLPNISPTDNTSPIFNPTSGAIQDPALIGWTDAVSPARFYAICTTNCSTWTNGNVGAQAWRYYPGATSSFLTPTTALPTCTLNAYQKAIAGCVPLPIACNDHVHLDQANHPNRNSQTSNAVNCLTHSENDNGDRVVQTPLTHQSFQFIGGDDNPITGAVNQDVMVSDSLVTVPVYDSSNGIAPPSTVQVIGFMQLFLNPDGNAASIGPSRVRTTIVNLVGCGTNATGQSILGHGTSPVPVRLVTQ
jgi:hypothetical protein